MKIENTSDFSITEIKELIKIARGSIPDKDVAYIFKSKAMHGWRGRMKYNFFQKSICLVDVKSGLKYPIRMNEHGGVDRERTIQNKQPDGSYKMIYRKTNRPFHVVNDWKELVLSITAHELYHFWLFKLKKKQSEAKCERYALKRIDRYREIKNLNIPTQL